MVGLISTQNFSFFLVGPNQLFWPCPSFMLIICSNVNTYCSRAACNQMVARAADEQRRRLPVSVVTNVIKRLSWCSRRHGLWLTLDPIFSSLRSSTKPLFIGGGRG
jgi:hypothetical protein